MIKQSVFGTIGGNDVLVFDISNSNGTSLSVTQYGAIWTKLIFKGKDVLLGYDTLEEYINSDTYFGATVGRFANRIKGGQFTLDGVTYNLALNNGNNNLHGGNVGFDKKIWNTEIVTEDGQEKLRLTYFSADMEEGFPGNLTATIDYYVTANDEIVMDEHAVTDKKTIVGFTQHSYFNLDTQGGDISNHSIMINADTFVNVDDELIPTGVLEPVVGTLDLRTPRKMDVFGGEDLIIANKGYDFCYSINGNGLRLAGTATCGNTELSVYSDKPGMQLYTGNFLDNIHGKYGCTYNIHSGFCLETSRYPDAPNQPSFDSAVLDVNDEYKCKTIFAFKKNN